MNREHSLRARDMAKQEYLRPHDVCVLLQLAMRPRSTFRDLAGAVGLSLGEAHNAAKRLELARLVILGEPSVNLAGALEFLTAGVPYSFPPQMGPLSRGIPTAFSAPPLAGEFRSEEMVVWPSPKGSSRGVSLTPLSPTVTEIWEKNPDLYRLLTLIDALRIGRARERQMARDFLGSAFKSMSAAWTE